MNESVFAIRQGSLFSVFAIRQGSLFSVFATRQGSQFSACAASSTVALDTSNSRTRSSISY